MAVHIDINPTTVTAKMEGAFKRGLHILGNEILADCNEYCKVDNHGLIDSSNRESRPDEGILIWDTEYARRQYWEIPKALTPGTTWKWCETAKNHHLSEWEALANKLVKDGLL